MSFIEIVLYILVFIVEIFIIVVMLSHSQKFMKHLQIKQINQYVV